MADESGAAVWSAYFSELAKGQEGRKISIEQRGIAVLTTSGAFVTLLFGLVALITKSDTFSLPGEARGPIGLALVALTAAALVGIVTNFPWAYRNVDADALEATIDRYLDDDASTANTRTARTWFDIYKAAASVNEVKARILFAAMFIQVIGLVLIAIAVREVLVHG